MKKALFLALMMVSALFVSVLSAQNKDIVVQSVSGKVQYEASAGVWKDLAKGMKILPSTVVNTGLNASLVLLVDGKAVTVKAMQKGTVEKLTATVANARTGVILGARVVDSNITSEGTTSRTNISTASTRASDAAEDLDWVEE